MKIKTRKEAYEWLTSLRPGVHQVPIIGTNRRHLEDVAFMYWNEYKAKTGNQKRPFQITSNASDPRKMDVIVIEHAPVLLNYREYGSMSEIVDILGQIADGETRFIPVDEAGLRRVRVICSTTRGVFSVNKVDGGCNVSRNVQKPPSLMRLVRDAIKSCVASKETVFVECSHDRVSYVRNLVSNEVKGMSVALTEGGVLISQSTGKEIGRSMMPPALRNFLRKEYAPSKEFRDTLKEELQAILNDFDAETFFQFRPGGKPQEKA